jgi:hypothetical protein
MYSISGKLIVKNDTEQIKDTFRKRDFVISDEDSQYPQEISFQLVQDKCDLLDAYQVGQNIKVNFNLRGRSWQNPQTQEMKYFNTLDAWKIEPDTQASLPQSSLPPLPKPPEADKDMDDSLPF